MTASPLEQLCLRSVPGLVGLLLLAAPLQAQTSPETPSVGQPIQLAPPSLFAPEPLEEGAASPEPATGVIKQGIEVNKLDEIASEAIGVLDSRDGGLGAAMWRGSERALIASLLRRLPHDLTSSAMRDLARRVLLSNAASPGGEAGENLVALRVQGLAALGDYDGVAALTAVAPQRFLEESVLRGRVDSLLLTGDLDTACREARNGMATYHGESYWSKALVFCQIIAGEADEAALGLALLREQGGDDGAYFALVEAISGAESELPEDVASTALLTAMLQFSGKKPGAGWLKQVPNRLLPVVAKMPSADLEDRAVAAERAVAIGALDGEALREIYAAFSFVPEQLTQAIDLAPALDGPIGRALLYQSARDESLPVARAEILSVALDSAAEAALYLAVVQVMVPLLSDVPAQPELLWFAESAARALFATGRFEMASAWLALAQSQVGVQPAAAEIVARLLPYARLNGFRSADSEMSLADWRQAWAQDGTGAREQLFLQASFQALGTPGAHAWSELAQDDELGTAEPLPNVALLYATQEAAAAGRIGEAVLSGLISLGQAGPGQSHPVALGGVLAAFRSIGLGPEARALAVEAALAKGI